MAHLTDGRVELQYLFYPLHQMHNVIICPVALPLVNVLHDNICISLKAKCGKMYTITYQPHCVTSHRSKRSQTSDEKQRHTFNKTEFLQ